MPSKARAWGMAGLRGTLAIAAPMSFGISHLSPVVADFSRQHPELAITLDYDDRTVDLVRGRFDLAVRIGQLRDSGLIVRKLCEDPRVVVASPDYVARRGEPQSLDELQAHASIGYLNVHAASVWQFSKQDGTAAGIAMQSRVTANNGEAMRDMAIAGLGVVLLPLFVAHEALRRGQLVRVAPTLKPVPLPISLVWPPIKPMPMKLRAIVDHLAKAFTERPPWLD
ncbi:substrate binding domain-containing protein [Mesorhizobium sp. UC22_110]|uniref:substrate binding domain-containing protein n=1 Tax=Mesorhizobium sp. UC22_110 TaxID=3374552 RepID=UPI003757A9C8